MIWNETRKGYCEKMVASFAKRIRGIVEVGLIAVTVLVLSGVLDQVYGQHDPLGLQDDFRTFRIPKPAPEFFEFIAA